MFFLNVKHTHVGGPEPDWFWGHGPHRHPAPQGSDRSEPDPGLQERSHGVRVHREGRPGNPGGGGCGHVTVLRRHGDER